MELLPECDRKHGAHCSAAEKDAKIMPMPSASANAPLVNLNHPWGARLLKIRMIILVCRSARPLSSIIQIVKSRAHG